MNILGISCYYHDAAAVLLCDGKIIAAGEEERFSRKKHDSSFPKKAIDFCLAEAGITASELDYVVFYEKPFRKFHRILISAFSTYPYSWTMFREAMRVWLTQKLWIKQEIASYFNIAQDKILFSEHHLSHAASSFYPSPFEKAAIMTIDGVGEWTTASYGIGEKNKIKIIRELHYPQSLGLLYSAFTAFLGFEVNEGEWKVMGLAPYGKPKYVDKVWNVVKLHDDGSFSLDFSYFTFQYSDNRTYSDKFTDLFGEPIPPNKSYLVTQKAADIAASIQVVTEEILLDMARNLRKMTKMDNLCLSGGVALNCVANYRLLAESGFKNIYVQPAAGDSGGALGAALYVYHHVLDAAQKNSCRPQQSTNKRPILSHAYLGQKWSNEEIEQFLEKENIKYKKLSDNKLAGFIAGEIAKGQVIGWMQGRFEWGPRALGDRSILADARNSKMKDIINSKVKFREAFRPFAPSVLAEKADMVFELFDIAGGAKGRAPDGAHVRSTGGRETRDRTRNDLVNYYPLRFMLYVVPVKKDWQRRVPAINHADNTARPQLVYKETNPLYYQLISAFYKKTGVPLVLNTSFNLKGEPIVNSPEDVYSTFIRSGIDILVMGNFVVEK
jgi:carbamoyltransferase